MLTDEMRAEGWREHDGGPCPVPLDSKPGVMFGNGDKFPPNREIASLWHSDALGSWSWNDETPEIIRIIAYKPENPDGNQ